MFEAAELGSKILKEECKAQVPALRAALLEAQQELRAAQFPVIVVFAGVDGAGKGETVNLLNELMDPRWIVTRAYGEPSDEECERPEFWRWWRATFQRIEPAREPVNSLQGPRRPQKRQDRHDDCQQQAQRK